MSLAEGVMETPTPEPETPVVPMALEARDEGSNAPNEPGSADTKPSERANKPAPVASRLPSVIVALVIAAVGGLSLWYLVRPQSLLVQGEVDATRLDIAARI